MVMQREIAVYDENVFLAGRVCRKHPLAKFFEKW
jgi:hypothetical protein